MARIKKAKFLEWAFGNVLENRIRGLIPEYLVHLVTGGERVSESGWHAFDLLAALDLKIEVKSSAYLQAWEQKKLSKIAFDIAPKRSWDARTNEYQDSPTRVADVYIFAVLEEKDPQKVDPLDLDQWSFIFAETTELNKHFGTQKTVTLSVLLEKGFEPCHINVLGPKFGPIAKRKKAEFDRLNEQKVD